MRGEREAHEGGVICILTVIHDVVQQEKNKNKQKKTTELHSLNSNSQTFITQLGLALHSDFIKVVMMGGLTN